MRLAKNRLLEQAFKDAHPSGEPIRYTQRNGYRLAAWVHNFFRKSSR